MSELLPCPFCGGTPDEPVDATRFLGLWRIIHRKCIIPNFAIESSERQDAIDRWNTRAALEPVTSREEALREEALRDADDAMNLRISETVLGEKVEFLSRQNAEQRELIEKLKSTLSEIAKPKVGPDFDWSENEVYKWRAIWYNKYENRAREVLKDV